MLLNINYVDNTVEREMYNSKYVQFVAHRWAYRHDSGYWHLMQRGVHFSGGFLTSATFRDFTDCFVSPHSPNLRVASIMRSALVFGRTIIPDHSQMQLKPLQHVAACITITFSLRWIPKWSPAARLDILRAVLLKIRVFWDVMPCGLIIRMTFRRTAAKEVWILKMKAQRSFETSLIHYRSTRRTHPSKSCCHK